MTNQRTAFESWATSNRHSTTRFAENIQQSWVGRYCDYRVEIAWEAWQAASTQPAINSLATEVIRAAMHGDQHFISCLKDNISEAFLDGQQYITCSVRNDERKTRLRVAIVAMADWLRDN